jgi:RIO kinase 1
MFYEGVLLMEAVVDAEGLPAQRLIDAAVPRERGAEFYADLCQQMVKMLSCDLIHGDLSPYNVLLAWNGPTVIDFPQVVGAAHNSRAEFFFQRDYQTIRRFFASLDPTLNGRGDDGREIWRAYERRELTSDFVPTGRLQETNRSHEPKAGHGPHSGHAAHRTPPHDPTSPQGHRGQASRQASRQAPRQVSRQAGLAAVNAAPRRGGAAPSSTEPRPPSPRNGPAQPSSASSPGPSRRGRRRRRRSH